MATLLAAATLLVAAGGCARKAPPPADPEARAVYVAHRMEQARTDLAVYPPQSASAIALLEEVTALEPDNRAAWLLQSDAYYQLRRYPEAIARIRRAEEIEAGGEELLYRKARALFAYHTYWTRGNYGLAREAAEACLAAGDTYLIECHAIIRNSYLGEAQAGGPSRSTYEMVTRLAEQLLSRIGESHPYSGDLHLLLAQYHAEHLGDAGRGAEHLAAARAAARDNPGLARRVATYDGERKLREVVGTNVAAASTSDAR